jgi:uncharacterized protein
VKIVILRVKVTPNARSNAITGWENDLLKIRLRATPEKGKANEMLTQFLAETLGIRPSCIRIIRGHTSRLKTLEILCTENTALSRLL